MEKAQKLAKDKVFPHRLRQLDLTMTLAPPLPMAQPVDAGLMPVLSHESVAGTPYEKVAGCMHLPQIWRLEEQNVC